MAKKKTKAAATKKKAGKTSATARKAAAKKKPAPAKAKAGKAKTTKTKAAAAKKAAAKKAAAKKAAPKKAAPKKAAPKKAAPKKAAPKKAAPKKAALKKAAAKKAAPKQAPARGAVKKPAARPATTKAGPPKKAAPAPKSTTAAPAKKAAQAAPPAKAGKAPPSAPEPKKGADASKVSPTKPAAAGKKVRAGKPVARPPRGAAAPSKKSSSRLKARRASRRLEAEAETLPPRDERELLLSDVIRSQRMREFGAARRHIDRFMERFPTDLRGLVYLANLKRAEGDRAGALEAYRGALRKDPNDPLALWWKADYHLREPALELNDAQKALKKIVQVLGRKQDEASRRWVEQAKDKLRYCDSRKHSLESRRYLRGKAGAPPGTRELKKARDLLKKALDAYPEDPRNHMNLGSVELQLGNVERAIELCKEAIELNPSYARAYLVLGQAFRARGQLRLAKDAFLQCIELDSLKRDSAEAWVARRQVEQDLARNRRRFFAALARRPGEEGEEEQLDLTRMKDWVNVLEGEPIGHADLVLDPTGHYVLTAYGERSTFRVFPGPEGLVIEGRRRG